MNLGAPEILLIVLAVFLLFGYKKLPDASRSIGRSLRIFKSEMKGMSTDDEERDAAARAKAADNGSVPKSVDLPTTPPAAPVAPAAEAAPAPPRAD